MDDKRLEATTQTASGATTRHGARCDVAQAEGVEAQAVSEEGPIDGASGATTATIEEDCNG